MTLADSRRSSEQSLLVIDGRTVEALIDTETALDLAQASLVKTSNGIAEQDIRRTLPLPGMPGTCLSLMYATLADMPHFGAKVLSVSPQNFPHGLPSHQGGLLLFEREHGRPVALLNAHAITGLRTSAASAVATRTLARPEARELAVIGYGEQADRHIEAISLVRAIRSIRVWGRDPEKAEAFAQSQRAKGYAARAFATAEEAVTGADIVCTVTSSRDPVLRGRWLTVGAHVNAVGASVAGLRELDTECVTRASVWVDYMPMAMVSASELIDSLASGIVDGSKIVGEIGSAIAGHVRGRSDPSEITLYRSLGVPAQDIEFANFIYQKAKAEGLGQMVSL